MTAIINHYHVFIIQYVSETYPESDFFLCRIFPDSISVIDMKFLYPPYYDMETIVLAFKTKKTAEYFINVYKTELEKRLLSFDPNTNINDITNLFELQILEYPNTNIQLFNTTPLNLTKEQIDTWSKTENFLF